jgi:tape measure domain-containing protein
MSTTIEREVVQMVFDAKQFQRGVEESIQSVESLKKSFNFEGAQQSMQQLNRMGSQDHFGPMTKSLDALNSKISLVGVAAAVAVTRLTNAVIDGSKQLFNTLIMAPIKTGLEEYETQLNAVQTILANTKKDGTTLEYVNEKLDELNEYADLTIYNFTQMTDSIGKFTAAGVDIDTSVASIKGIANVAALSGSNAQQASTAMYQLSQAMASGTVRLQDWMSVENAGMGGAVFQDALIETARVHGIAVDEMIKKNGSFRLSLQEGWLSSDLMAETLQKFTGDLTAEQLLSMGYAEEQIAGIMEMAEAANDAATKIKTLTQLKDTMAEALQSGWGQTWRIIFGDFEEAKALWGGIAEVFGGIIDQSSTARNTMLEMWAEIGGRRALIDGFMNILQGVINILSAFGEAIREVFEPLDYVDLFQITFAFYNFSKSFLEGTKNLGPFKTIVEAVASVLWIVLEVVDKVVKEIRSFVSTLDFGGEGILDFILGIAEAIISFREWAEETDYIDMQIETLISNFGRFTQKIKELVKEFMELEIIQDISNYLGGLESKDFINAWNAILTVVRAVATPIIAVAYALRELYYWVAQLDVVENITESFKAINYSSVKTGFAQIADNIKAMLDSVKNNEVLQKFGEFFATFDGRRFNAFIDNAKTSLGGFFDILKKFNKESEKTPDNIEATTDAVAEGSTEMQDAIIAGLDKMIAQAGTLDYSKIFEALNTGIFAALVLSIRKFANMDILGDAVGASIFGSDSPIAKSIEGTFRTFEGTMKSVQSNIKSETLKNIAIAVALLAGSIFLLTLIDSVKLIAATGAIAGLIAALFVGTTSLNRIDTTASAKAAVAIIGISVALIAVGVALRALQGLDPEGIETTVAVMAASLGTLVIAINALGGKASGTDTIKSIALLISLSTSLYALYGAIRLFGNLKPEVLAQGLQGMAASLGILTTSLILLTRLQGSGILLAAAAIVEMAAALVIFAQVIQMFGEMKLDVMAQGLKAVGAAMLSYSVLTRVMKGNEMIGAGIGLIFFAGALRILVKPVQQLGAMNWEKLKQGLLAVGLLLAGIAVASKLMTGGLAGAAAMLVMSAAMLGFAAAVKVLSSLSWGELLVALAGMVGIFAVLGLAGLALAPVAPILLLLGAAMLLIGVAAAAIGLGVSLAATGLVALAASAAAIAAGITLVGGAIMELLPRLAEAIAVALVNFLTVIADNQPLIIDAMHRIIVGMIDAIWGLIPDIVAVMMDMITALLKAIADRLPDLIQQGYDILLAFLQGIADNVADIIATGLMIVAEIINGIAEGIPDLIDSAFNLILTFLNAMADAIEEYMPQIIAAGGRIGIALVEGIVKGLTDNAQQVYDFVKGMANKAIDKIKESLGITSPSKKMIEVGRYMVLGLVKGIKDNTTTAVSAMGSFAEKVQNGINSLQDQMALGLDEAFGYNPVVTPVLNLDEISSGARRLNTLLSGNPTVQLAAALNTGAYVPDQNSLVETGQANAGVVYNQYNYSPKALDPTEIFRKTKTQVAKVAL